MVKVSAESLNMRPVQPIKNKLYVYIFEFGVLP